VLPALPAAAAAAEPDLIFAAIERHRRAYQDWFNSLGEDEIEAAVPEKRRRSCLVAALHGDPNWRVPGDDPAWISHIETACRVTEEMEDASVELVSFDNISLPGAVALLSYAASVEAKDRDVWPTDMVDDDDKSRSWHFFLMEGIAAALAKTAA